MTSPVWRIAVVVPASAASTMARAFEPLSASVAVHEAADGRWRVEGLALARPDDARVTLAVALAAAARGIDAPPVTIEALPDRDWVGDSRRRMPALRIGRFLVRGTHIAAPVSDGRIDLCVDAGVAFGSGHHSSTAGCLIAIDRLAVRRARVRQALDLGCGSGILGIAIAKRWRVPVLALDIDPSAVAVARANARLNGVGPLVRTAAADGLSAPLVARRRPFDLVVANILARPLRRLAAAMAATVAPGGTLILAGFVVRSSAGVLATYRGFGFRPAARIDDDGWRTLVLVRRRPRSPLTTSGVAGRQVLA